MRETCEHLITTEMLAARAHVLIEAGPAPRDVEHPGNVALGHLLRSLSPNVVLRTEQLIPLCDSLCLAVLLSGRDEVYCCGYARALGLLCAGLGMAPPAEEQSEWRKLLTGGDV